MVDAPDVVGCMRSCRQGQIWLLLNQIQIDIGSFDAAILLYTMRDGLINEEFRIVDDVLLIYLSRLLLHRHPDWRVQPGD